MILIFDLDETLYEERTYVESGFRSVACWLETQFAWDRETSYRLMTALLEQHGRGRVFDRLLAARGITRKSIVRHCVKVYRHHLPEIQLWPAARGLLQNLPRYPLYLITDGHKIAQARKVEALGIAHRFRKVYLTHRYGLRSAKPSTACFERVRTRENCPWTELVHIADNPAKDFVNLTPLGVHTVRVLTGGHRDAKAAPGHDARYRIPDLTHLPQFLQRIQS
ncbi:MAG: HAD family hydrolase [Acidobacteriia bacterium]|nr:HAD family hydrolase [Terriglobia bacterium]